MGSNWNLTPIAQPITPRSVTLSTFLIDSQARKIFPMRLIISLILPWLTFFTIGRPIAGVICLILQLTLVGWIPATIWAVYALSQYKTDEKIKNALNQRSA